MQATGGLRIEADPLQVPVAAPMQRPGSSFADRLDAATAEAEAAATRQRVDPRHPEPATGDAAADQAVANDEANAPDRDPVPHDAYDDAANGASAEPAADSTNATTTGQPSGRTLAATTEQTGSSTSGRERDVGAGRATNGNPLAGAIGLSAQQNGAARGASHAFAGVAGASATAASSAAAAKPVAATPAALLRGDTAPAPQPALPRAQAAQAGYRTWTPQAVQLAEQARDSVFQQIVLQLRKDGGEMRVRLDPPDLGELDLRLVVEKHNVLRLSIGAERPELAQLLERNLDQLKHALQQAGLEVAHAEVHHRSDDAKQRGHGAFAAEDELARARGTRGDGEDGGDAAAALGAGRGRGNVITAEGLDFWV